MIPCGKFRLLFLEAQLHLPPEHTRIILVLRFCVILGRRSLGLYLESRSIQDVVGARLALLARGAEDRLLVEHFILGRLQLNLDPRLSGDVVGARLVVIIRRTKGGLLAVGGLNNTNFPQRAGREVVAAGSGLARAHVRFGCAFAEMGRRRESLDEKK
jgi:hypothetical protein